MKTLIALMAIAGSLALPNAFARDESRWDSTRAHVQLHDQQQQGTLGRNENRWDSTRAHVQNGRAIETSTLSSDAEQWDSTRRIKPQRTGDRRKAEGNPATICACLANGQLA